MKPNKICVTGATGYIGSSLVRYLSDNGYGLVAILQEDEEWYSPAKVEIRRGDTANSGFLADAMAGSDIVIHLAGFKGYDACLKDESRALETNVSLTKKIVEALRGSKAKVIFSSTYWVYGHKSAVPYHEDGILSPSEPYGRSKAAAESAVASSGIEYTIVRLANVFGYGTGAGHNEVASLFLMKALAGETIILNNAGRNCLDLVSIDDLCKAFMSIVRLEEPRLILNIGSGRPVSVLELAEKVNTVSEKINGKKAKIVKGAAEADEILYADRWVDITRLKKLTGFVPEPLEASLERLGRLLLSEGAYETRAKGSETAIS